MAQPINDLFERARLEAGLTHGELWFRYFQLGGMRTGFEIEAFCHGALVPSDLDHDIVAHALNERLFELGGRRPVAYSDQHRESTDESPD
jgi:hypothetical protein